MKKSSLFALLLVLFVSACTSQLSPAPAGGKITLEDALGRSVMLSAPAQKIISLAPSNTEILYALGAGGQVVARDDYSNYPAEAQNLPSLGDTMGTLSFEQITNLQPDLVLATPLTSPEQVKSIEDLGTTIFVLPNPITLPDLYDNLNTVGVLTGRENEAKTLVNSLKDRVAIVEKKLTGLEEKPLVFYELDGTDPAKPWTAGPGTFVDYLIQQAGGINLGAKLSGEWVQISQEELILQDPDIILLGDALYGGVTAQQVAARPGWAQINAVKNGRVLPINDDLVSRPGPRMVDGLEELAKILHPEVFK
ncbi:MAG: cobalamin-binding protein [Anaerolineaceae bacterium]|nr:cobalamin-binding protein [Anaerolineaceae bacterium]